MGLQEKLDAKRKEFESSVPQETLSIMHRATEDLRSSGILDRALGVGAMAPDFTLKNIESRPVHLKSELSREPVVLGFYRGRW
jgi:hypothetical protein